MSLDTGKYSIPNIPNLKQWNYDTSTNISQNYKLNTIDPIQRPMKVHFDKMNYIMPQFEKVCENNTN